MTYEEATDVLAIVYAYYQANFKNFSEANASAVAFTWSVSFKNVPVEVMYIAIMKWIDSHKFPPKTCEIKDIISRTLYYEAKGALDYHEKHQNLSPKALKQYQNIFQIASGLRSYDSELTLSDFINDDGDYLLYGTYGNDRLLE